ncbi:hypothetical protein QUF58_13655 [Anaerolineales bacterium HSG24]|nr:hypothetical protein [Anaerolineales bacterium HSG24]
MAQSNYASPQQSRWVSFAGQTVEIIYDSPEAQAVIEFLYQYVQPDPQTAPQVQFRLFYDAPLFHFYRTDELLYQGDNRATLAGAMLGNMGYSLADKNVGGLFFHSAGLSWQGRGILLPGASGAGKTTLTAWLVSRGFQYLSDEFIFIAPNSHTMQAFTRPLNLKLPARPVLKSVLDYEGHADQILTDFHADLVPPALLGCAKPGGTPPLKLILFPGYGAQADEFSWQELSKAQTGLQLMQTVINARNLPQHGFFQVTRLAKTVPAIKLRYGSFDQLGQQIERYLESLPLLSDEMTDELGR